MIVHIGFHKTATTWLQDSVFPFIKDVNYLGISSHIKKEIKWVCTLRRELPQKIDIAGIREKISKLEKESIVLLSDERFSGHMLTGQGAIDYADRIREISNNIKVIICIRRQVDMWESIYRQYIKEGGCHTFKEFYEEEGCGSDFFYLGNLEYSNLVSYYIKLLGRKNVLVIPYEKLVINKKKFLEQIMDFIDSKDTDIYSYIEQKKDNKSIGYYETNVLRILNTFMKTGIRPRPGYMFNSRYVKWLLKKISISSKKKFVRHYQSDLEQRYSADNLKLDKLLPELNLNDYGYVKHES